MMTAKSPSKPKVAPVAELRKLQPASATKAVKTSAAAKTAASTASKQLRSAKDKALQPVAAAAAASDPAPVQTQARAPKAFLALAVEAGIFLLGSLPEGASKIAGLGFYAAGGDKLVLCCLPAKGGVLLVDDKVSQQPLREHKFLGFLPIPAKLLGPNATLNFGAVQEDGLRTRFPIAVTRMQSLDDAMRKSVLREYRHLFVPAVTTLVPADHPLRKAIGAAAAPAAPNGAARSAPAAAIASAKGFFDEIAEGRAEGWAFDPANPTQRPVVEIMEGSRVVARGVADGFRADLLQAGIGDGRYCFKLPLSYELRDGKPHRLTARIAKTGQVLQIKGGGDGHAFLHPRENDSEFDFIPPAVAQEVLGELVAGVKEAERKKELAFAFGAGQLAIETRELAAAARAFLNLLHRFGDQPIFFCKVAESYVLGARYQDAINLYQKAIECAPKFGWAWMGLAGAHRLLNACPEAEAAYRKAVELLPEQGDASKRVAQALINAGKAENAIEILKSCLLKSPHDEEACVLLEKAFYADSAKDSSDDLDRKDLKAFEANRQLLDILLDSAEALLEARK